MDVMGSFGIDSRINIVKRYEKFLVFWKDADEDLPEKQDAKVRLARLKE